MNITLCLYIKNSHTKDLNAKSKIEVNYWCPAGMIPIKISPEEEKVD